jgi:hypothetical protein
MTGSRTNAAMRPALGALAALLAGAALAQAKPDRMVLPVAPVLAQPQTQQVLGGFTVRFGAPQPHGRVPHAPGTEIRAMSWARPTDTRGYGNRSVGQAMDGRPMRLTDAQTCQLALRYTLAELVEEARKRGAQSVVDVVSTNNDVEMNSPTSFECIPGHASSTVTLRGRIGAAPLAVAAAAPQAIQPAAEAPASFASGYAALGDIDAIPYLDDKGREDYRRYIALSTPKAFAIATTGHWANAWTLRPQNPAHPTDPTERALLLCSQRSGGPCKLYAVNNTVVWRK